MEKHSICILNEEEIKEAIAEKWDVPAKEIELDFVFGAFTAKWEENAEVKVVM